MAAPPELIAFISHELRDPLSSVLGSVAQLRDPGGARRTAQRLRHLDVIEANALRVEALLDDLSLVTQLDAGEAPRLLRKRVAVSSILDEAAVRARKLAGARRVALEVRCDVAEEIDADPRRLSRALAALASASMTFARDDTTIVWAAWRVEERVSVDVDDPGIAVRDEDAPRVSDPEFWASRPRAVGVRLALRAAILVIRLHGGEVTRVLDPQPVLRVSLPLAD